MTRIKPPTLRTGVMLTGAGLALVAARRAARQVTTPSPVETQFLTPWELGVPYEEVSFTTGDGLRLGGWWLPKPGAGRTVIVLCGYNSARHHVLGISAALWRGGANVLLFDNRGRGDSEGDRVSLGYHERLDAKAAVGYALLRDPEAPLGVLGYSMGGAVALMVAAGDARIEAVVADSPFASQTALLRARLRDYVGPLESFRPTPLPAGFSATTRERWSRCAASRVSHRARLCSSTATETG